MTFIISLNLYNSLGQYNCPHFIGEKTGLREVTDSEVTQHRRGRGDIQVLGCLTPKPVLSATAPPTLPGV